ncbi:ABC transporter substrate-binding protein [Aminobacter aganoensis]|uniref:Peptide/nickel transport system substrate-binding protein n=1 Tax=Aminobacter aganoensis TaxID=83264 RepID=A0A7X0FAN5_9HYPH|nr:ABC transporter substrate-binding protein [Aminobacter aganoensis]MBB6356214.1 peptide/nickel transport system substrate-binding protein [Aminobacter aganoensis]
MKLIRSTIAGLLLATSLSSAALAADLTVGMSTEPSSVDPQFSRTGNNQNLAQQVFGRLVEPDANLQIHPNLAESWKNTDPLTWEVKLRQGVKFHDGSPLTAEDVIYSLERVSKIENSPAPFTANVGPIDKMEIVDPQTIRFTTKKPTPQFMELAGMVYIVSKKATEGKTSQDFIGGAAAIGTGPYKFVEWVPGDRLVLQRNDEFWGEKPEFEKVTFRAISNAAARVAALRSGAVDLIDGVPPADVATLKGVENIALHSTPSSRIIYLALDSARDESPFVTDSAGKKLVPNPLKDTKVRQAISKMVDRQLLIDRILSGAGVPAGQLVPAGIGGHSDKLEPGAIDLEGAKKLLAEAGVPDGFGITVHSSNDRFAGDGDVAQALGQLFARGGLKVNGVVTQPYNVYAGAAGKQEFSAFIFSFGTTTPSSASGMNNVLMTYDKEAGTGSFNRARYSNPAYDEKMRAALAEFDAHKRNALLAEAAEIAFNDVAIVPLYWPVVTWASRADIAYTANKAEDTLAAYARTVK